jgi:hypothetical protein
MGASEKGVLFLKFGAECLCEASLDHMNCQVCNVNPDPTPAQNLRRLDSCAASTKRIKNNVALIGRGGDNSL